MSFKGPRRSKLGRLAFIAALPLVAAHCGSDEPPSGGKAHAGETNDAEGGAAPDSSVAGSLGVGGTTSQAGETGEAPPSGGVPGVGEEDPSGTGGGTTTESSSGGTGQDGEGGAGGDTGPSSTVAQLPDSAFTAGEAPETNNPSKLAAITGLKGASATTNGGTTIVRIELEGKPEPPTFVVSIDGDEGFFIATATDLNGDGIYEIEVHVGKDVNLSRLVVRVAPIDAAGNVGEYHSLEYDLVKSGVGDVKVTLSFDQEADLDLHVVDPTGFEIFFDEAKSVSPSGGKLDLDSNANCVIDGTNTENVFWADDTAPVGTYRVSVVNFDACAVTEPVNYTVTIYNGPAVETFRGTFETGSDGEQRVIATFVH